MTRLGPLALPILVLVAGFRMPGYISSAMAVPLFKSLHYSDTDIATVTKLFGFWVGLGGTFLASYIIPRSRHDGEPARRHACQAQRRIWRSLISPPMAIMVEVSFGLSRVAVSLDSFAYAFASIVLITYMSSLASTQLAASQYALLTSICALPGSLLAGISGFVVERLGFEHFFVETSLIGAPVAFLCWWIWRRQAGGT